MSYYLHTCKCGCGGQIEVKKHHSWYGVPKYMKGHNKSNFKHGFTKIKLYSVWTDMKTRCLNTKRKSYKDWGGRGITICPEWTDKLNGFIKFRDWSLNNGYTEGLQIHRENDGNYEPYNCEWVTNTENARHRRGQKIKNIEMANEIRELEKIGNHTRKELAEKYGVSQMQISNIINNKKWV